MPNTEKKKAYDREYYAANADKKRKQARQYYSENINSVKDKAREHRLANRESVMLKNARNRARDMCIPFSISIKDIEIPDTCPILGITIAAQGPRTAENSPELDRIVPELGYTRENVQVISRRANRYKNNASISELVLLGEWAKRRNDATN